MTHPIIAIIFNAPPRCGKDTLGRLIPKYLSGPVRITSFKEALFDATHDRMFEEFRELISRDWWGGDDYDDVKDDRVFLIALDDGFEGTARECLIHVSEDIIKPMHGAQYFGEQAAAQMQPGYNIFTDGGFGPELEAIIEKADDVILIQLSRDGYDFSSDSRNYINPEDYAVYHTCGDITGQTPKESAADIGSTLVEWELGQTQKCFRYHAMREGIPAPYLETFS